MNSLKGEEEVEYGYGDYVEVSKIFVLWIIFCILVIIWFLSIDLRVYVCLWINIYICDDYSLFSIEREINLIKFWNL